MNTTDRRQTKASLNASTLWGRRHNKDTERFSNSALNYVLLMRYTVLRGAHSGLNSH